MPLLGEGARKAQRGSPFAYTSDPGDLIRLPQFALLPAPSLVWSARSPWRRLLSRHWNEHLLRRHAETPLLRLGVHPVDLQHNSVRRFWLETIEQMLSRRVPVPKSAWLGLNRRSTGLVFFWRWGLSSGWESPLDGRSRSRPDADARPARDPGLAHGHDHFGLESECGGRDHVVPMAARRPLPFPMQHDRRAVARTRNQLTGTSSRAHRSSLSGSNAPGRGEASATPSQGAFRLRYPTSARIALFRAESPVELQQQRAAFGSRRYPTKNRIRTLLSRSFRLWDASF
jgi:hypothetical protein